MRHADQGLLDRAALLTLNLFQRLALMALGAPCVFDVCEAGVWYGMEAGVARAARQAAQQQSRPACMRQLDLMPGMCACHT